MPTQAKIEEVACLKEKFERAAALVLTDYRGLTANEMVGLRARFTKAGIEFRVVKDTLARIAAKQVGLPELVELFNGPIGVAIGYDEPVLAFKLCEECRKAYSPNYALRGGMFEGVIVPEAEVERYVTLPPREEMLATLAMLLTSPMRALAMCLQAKLRELATVINEVRKQREQSE